MTGLAVGLAVAAGLAGAVQAAVMGELGGRAGIFPALAFSGIGVYQYATRDVFWNPKVIVGNAYAPFYRVNSVFYDPSVYGRFLVVAILAALVLALYDRDRRAAYASGAAIILIWLAAFWPFSAARSRLEKSSSSKRCGSLVFAQERSHVTRKTCVNRRIMPPDDFCEKFFVLVVGDRP